MKSVYIFTRLPNAFAPRRLAEELKKLGHVGRIIDYAKVVFSLKDGSIGVSVENENLPLPDVVIFRAPGMDGFCTATRDALLIWFKQNKVRVLNGDTFSGWSTLDKLTQHVEFQNAHIPSIESQVFTDIEVLAKSITSYPVIVKSYLGSHGDGVKKITNANDISILKKEDAPFLLQPFLKSGRDVRVIVMGGKAIGAMLRTAQEGAYLTNFSAGGAVELFNLTENPEVAEIAEKTAHHFECEYAGVDLMQDEDGGWNVLEINRSCQFEGFEQATGDNVARKLLQYLLQ